MKRRKKGVTANLIQFDEMPPERHRELSALGGIASGEARRKNKELAESAYKMLEYHAQREELREELREFVKWRCKKEKYAEEYEEFLKWRKREARAKRGRTAREGK